MRNPTNGVFALSILLAACGGGGGGDGETPASNNIGWISVSSSRVSSPGAGQPVAELNGEAFVSQQFVGHQVGGFCLLLCWFDNSYPGVDVTWENQTLMTAGSARSRYGTATSWKHVWSASVPMAAGSNTIVVRAEDRAGNNATAVRTLAYSPPPPHDILADTGDGQITLLWDSVYGALSYNIYWSAVPGVTAGTASLIANAASPFTVSGLTNGVTYYFVLTTISNAGESTASTQVSATAGAPRRPTGVNAQSVGADISVSWEPVAGATSYNLYWANQTGVTKGTGTLIASVTTPFLHSGLTGVPYFYVVTALNGIGESLWSLETTAMPQLPPPPPSGLTVTQPTDFGVNYQSVRAEWSPVPGALLYDLRRCDAWTVSSGGTYSAADCRTFPVSVYLGAQPNYIDFEVVVGQSYRYSVSSLNAYGSSAPSADVGIFVAQ